MARDRYQYFRIEARELIDGLVQGALDLEKGRPAEEVIPHLLRQAHTLKGSARVVGQAEIADQAHGIEDALAPMRAGEAPSPELIGRVMCGVEAIEAHLVLLGVSEPRPEAPVAVRSEDAFETVRLDLKAMDVLLEAIGEAKVQMEGLQQQVTALSRLRQSLGPAAIEEVGEALEGIQGTLSQGLDRTESELQRLSALADQARLLPASLAFMQLERAARDAAQTLGKPLVFETAGGDVRLDAHILHALRDALLHVVRNAVDHGLEPESERLAQGKPPQGRIQLRAERRGDRIVVSCHDDGRGIDPQAILRSAVQRGLVSQEMAETLTAQEALQLIFQAGMSTRQTVSELSGRGVGLDVVRENLRRLRGEARVSSEPGVGTHLELIVPPMLSASSALVLSSGETFAAVPLEAVRRTVRISDEAIARSVHGASVLIEDRALPFISLEAVLDARDAVRYPHWSVALVEAPEGTMALGAERLIGVSEVVVRPLPKAVGTLPLVAGVSLDTDGTPRPVLDPTGLVLAARTYSVEAGRPTPVRRSVLVVDDSLTSRMLEESILESAGYEVDLAACAEEALEMVRRRPYALFVVDVEMPGMNGFDFIATIRRDPELSAVPAILVTSRGAPEDRRRGLEVGAQDYILKGEFEQDRFLASIHRLLEERHG